MLTQAIQGVPWQGLYHIDGETHAFATMSNLRGTRQPPTAGSDSDTPLREGCGCAGLWFATSYMSVRH